jgi:ATP-binding cassette subfamily C (CFTR/MRP) protein 1
MTEIGEKGINLSGG